MYLGTFDVGSTGEILLRDSTGAINVVTAMRSNRDGRASSSSSSSSSSFHLKPSYLEDVWTIRPFVGMTIDAVPYALIDMRDSCRLLLKRKRSSVASECCKCDGGECKSTFRLRLTSKDARLPALNRFTATFSLHHRRRSLARLTLLFKNLDLHGLLRVDDYYRLSGVCETCLDKHLGAKVVQSLAFDSKQMALLDDEADEEIGVGVLSNIKNVVDILKDDQPNTLHSFAGYIASHAITESSPADGPSLEITIRDVTAPDDVRVYFDLKKYPAPFGMAVGLKVALLGVSRRVSQKGGRVYCVANATTVVEILEFGCGDGLCRQRVSPSLESLVGAERVRLCDFSYDAAGNPLVRHTCTVQCCITACQRASFKWICSTCRQVLCGRDCGKKCGGEGQFLAETRSEYI